MLCFGSSKRIMQKSNGLTKIAINHVTQVGNDGCWAAAAEMIGCALDKHFRYDQKTLANTYVRSTPAVQCDHPACVISTHGGSFPSPDRPLCLKCQLVLLNRYSGRLTYMLEPHCNAVKNYYRNLPQVVRLRKSAALYRQEFSNIKNILSYGPVCVYSSIAGGAHYSVLHGCFSIKSINADFHFVMVADPWERGSGVCDFDTFVKVGKYMRSRARKALPSLYWNATLIG